MKMVATIALALVWFVLAQAESVANDWIQLDLQNGSHVSGYVVKVTEENVHLVGTSINRLIPKTQLSEESQAELAKQFLITASPAATEKSTATQLRAGMQEQREQLYQRVSDIYSPRSRYYRSNIYGPYQRTYYLPQGYSLAYPVYHHYYRPYHSFPRWSINIDL